MLMKKLEMGLMFSMAGMALFYSEESCSNCEKADFVFLCSTSSADHMSKFVHCFPYCFVSQLILKEAVSIAR